ncbi:hypothetical protein RB601_003680 [Gaeumannomyces tritici]
MALYILASFIQISLGLCVIAGLVYFVASSIYNLYFHPLARFPGPLSGAIQDIWVSRKWVGGRWPHEVEKLHEKYGDVVRIAPNELSFSHPDSMKDIYGQVNINHPKFIPKSRTFYQQTDVGRSVGTEVDPVIHQKIRKLLAPGFSASALKRQEDVVLHYIDLLVEQIKVHGSKPGGMDMTDWFTWLAFDVVVDLAFGDSFQSVENGCSNEWLEMLVNSGFQVALGFVVRRRARLFQQAVRFCLTNEKSKRMRNSYVSNARNMAAQRLARGADVSRFDFFTPLVGEKSPDATVGFLAAQGSTLVAAGTETTATFLTGLTFYLLKNPEKLARMQAEVRARFGTSAEITDESTRGCPYLCAVVEEGLRIFNPAAFGLPRVSPGTHVQGHWVPEGTILAAAGHVTSRDPRWFYKAREFRPERWLPREHPAYDPVYEGDRKDASKPFSIGSRSCIGINLSYMEIRICVAKLAWNFDWHQVDPAEDFVRDAKLLGLWKGSPLHIGYAEHEKDV